MSTPDPVTFIIDDNDPGLVWTGDWAIGGGPEEYSGTTHGSRSKGATFQYKFSGTSISVYGTLGPFPTNSSYRVDDSSPAVYTPTRPLEIQYQHLFWESPTLTNGDHTLLVTNVGTGELWFDFILYNPPPDPGTSPEPSSPPSSPDASPNTTTTTSPTTPRPPSTPTTSPTTKPPVDTGSDTGLPSTSQGKSSVPVSAVIGAAVGALVLIIALIFGMLYYRKRARPVSRTRMSEKDILVGSPGLDRAHPGAATTSFSVAYTPGPHTSSAHGSSTVNMHSPGSAYPLADHGYWNEGRPPVPMHHLSNDPAFRPGYTAPPDNVAGAGPGPGYGRTGHGGSQYGGTQASSNAQSDYFQSGGSQYGGIQQNPSPSSEVLAPPQRPGSPESVESGASLAYLSDDRVAMHPPSPLPDAAPRPLPTPLVPQHTGKSVSTPNNNDTTGLRQHEDGGVRLDIQRPQGSSPQQQQMVDLPPAYRPNY